MISDPGSTVLSCVSLFNMQLLGHIMMTDPEKQSALEQWMYTATPEGEY